MGNSSSDNSGSGGGGNDNNTDNTNETYYHHTSEKNAEKILDSGEIRQSSDGLCGKGTYLTKMSPDTDRTELFLNNYDDNPTAQQIANDDRLDAAFEVQIRADDPKLERCTTDRDVYIYRDNIPVDKK